MKKVWGEVRAKGLECEARVCERKREKGRGEREISRGREGEGERAGERETERDSERDSDREGERETEREREKHRNR